MIRIFALIVAINPFLVHAQDKFNIDQSGLGPSYLVIDVPHITQGVLFNKAINWIKESYQNPGEVIKTTIDSQMIRFEGLTQNAAYFQNAWGTVTSDDALYTIELSFKAGKYKFHPLSLELLSEPTLDSDGRYTVDLVNGNSGWYNEKGDLRRYFKSTPKEIADLFNTLNQQLHAYIVDENKGKNDW